MKTYFENLPIILVLALAAGVTAWLVTSALVGTDTSETGYAPGEWEAMSAAKRAYYASDHTVARANCVSIGHDDETGTWEIKCTLERAPGEVEETVWEVTPDGVATQVSS